MDAIEFPEQTLIIAKDQPQYIPLPVHLKYYQDEQGNPLVHPESLQPVPEEMTCCFKLSPEEIQQIVNTGELWYTQCVFGNQFQPVRMSVLKPTLVVQQFPTT